MRRSGSRARALLSLSNPIIRGPPTLTHHNIHRNTLLSIRDRVEMITAVIPDKVMMDVEAIPDKVMTDVAAIQDKAAMTIAVIPVSQADAVREVVDFKI